MPTRVTLEVAACLGDSLTANPPTGGKCWPTHVDISSQIFPRIGTGNFGKSGNTAAQMQVRFTDSIKGQGFKCLVVQGFINSIVGAGLPAATIWAQAEALVDDAIDDGMKVVLVITSGFGNSGSWSAPLQAVFEQLRTLMLEKSGVEIVDLYTGMADPANPIDLNQLYDSGDGLHWNAAGTAAAAALIIPKILLALPAPVVAATPTPTSVNITWADVTALAPELAAVPAAGQAQVLAQVVSEIGIAKWGGLANANNAATWLARHLATMSIRRGMAELTSVSVGQVSKTFASPSSAEALNSNPYGQEYLRLARKWLPRMFVL